ncbi:hypothetical protein [Telmatospirillum siberiense]|nr:hypothetical protein [Telmatospirillum siberiense]
MRPVSLPPTAIHDLTLGLGSPSLSIEARRAVARAITAVGAQEISVGRPADGPAEAEAATAIAAAIGRDRAIACCRLAEADVDAARATGLSAVHLAAPLSESAIRAARESDRIAVLSDIRRVVRYARGLGMAVTLGGEDAGRAEIDYVCAAMIVAWENGARRFRVSDSSAALDPFSTHAIFRHLCAETDMELEFHGSDARGMAAANTVAAVRGGATHACASVLGLGGPGGTAPLDEVMETLLPLDGRRQTGRKAQMAALADRVLSLRPGGRRPKAAWPAAELSADWVMRTPDLDVLSEAGRYVWVRPAPQFAALG